VITETQHPSSVEPGRRPWRNWFIVLAVVLIVLGLVGLGFGIDLWVSHVSYAACVAPAAYARISQAEWNHLVGHCRSVGALHNRGIVLTFSGAAAVVVGFGTGVAVRTRHRSVTA